MFPTRETFKEIELTRRIGGEYKVVSIHTKKGTNVFPKRRLCEVVSGAGERVIIKAKNSGIITQVLVKVDDVIVDGSAIVELEACGHTALMGNICCDCGVLLEEKDMPKTQAVSMLHSVPDLKIARNEARKLGEEDIRNLLKLRKLVLLVDLDQTLIHTTNDNIPPDLKDVYHFQLSQGGPWYHARLRPHTRQFLEKISRYYELHISTFGVREYAHHIAHFLDPDRKLFGQRILSRNECLDMMSKKANLDSLFPCGDNLVCIIDDRTDVWNFAPNVVQVVPYHFFRHTGDINAPSGLQKTEHDDRTGIDFRCLGKEDLRFPDTNTVSEEDEDKKNYSSDSEGDDKDCTKGDAKKDGSSDSEVKKSKTTESTNSSQENLCSGQENPSLGREGMSSDREDANLGRDVSSRQESMISGRETGPCNAMESEESEEKDGVKESTKLEGKNIKIEEKGTKMEECDTKAEECDTKVEESGAELEGKEMEESERNKMAKGCETSETSLHSPSEERGSEKQSETEGESKKQSDSEAGETKASTRGECKTVSEEETESTVERDSDNNNKVSKENEIKVNKESEKAKEEEDTKNSHFRPNGKKQKDRKEAESNKKLTEILSKKNKTQIFDVVDNDDYLLYLEDILFKIHQVFFREYDISIGKKASNGKGEAAEDWSNRREGKNGSEWGTEERERSIRQAEEAEDSNRESEERAESKNGANNRSEEREEIKKESNRGTEERKESKKLSNNRSKEREDWRMGSNRGIEEIDNIPLPDLKQIVPAIRKTVLKGVNIVFSSVIPQQMKLHESKAYFIATSFGAHVSERLELRTKGDAWTPSEPRRYTTHLVAANRRTEKVNLARKHKYIKIVTPNWLWKCAERWELVEEMLFPLSRESEGEIQRLPPHHCYFLEPPKLCSSAVPHSADGSDCDEEGNSEGTLAGPSSRTRTPSGTLLEDVNPLIYFSSVDRTSMTDEVEKILSDEDDDDSYDDEGDVSENDEAHSEEDEEDEEDDDDDGEPQKKKRRCDDDDEEMENEDELPSVVFRQGGGLPSDDSDDEGETDDEGDLSRMGADLESLLS